MCTTLNMEKRKKIRALSREIKKKIIAKYGQGKSCNQQHVKLLRVETRYADSKKNWRRLADCCIASRLVQKVAL